MFANAISRKPNVCLFLSAVVLSVLAVPDLAWAPCRRCLSITSCSTATSGGCICQVFCGEGGCSCTISCPCANNKCSPCAGPSQAVESDTEASTEQLAHVRWWSEGAIRPLANDMAKVSPTFALLVANLGAGLRSNPCFARAVLLTGASGKAGPDDEEPASIDWNLTVAANGAETVWTFQTDSSFENDASKANRLELRVQRGSASWRLYENESTRGSGDLRSSEIMEETALPPPKLLPGKRPKR